MMRDVSVTMIKFESKFEFYKFLDSKPDYIKIYTDGSKTNNRTSFAFYDSSTKAGKVFSCNNMFSVYSSEILAIIYALKYISVNYCSNSFKFLILSDSMSALLALNNNCISNKCNYLIYELRNLITSLFNNNIVVEFCWVPGHSGILGNELVDALAKSSSNVAVSDSYKVPHSDLVLHLKTILLNRWTLALNSSRSVKGKWLAEIAPAPSTKAWFERASTYFGRRYISTMCRLRIGHCKFPAHMFRLKLAVSTSCQYCNLAFCDLDHLIFNCKTFNVQRLLFITDGLVAKAK
ncbi:uncharacterized protein LOC126369100 [Pectinophora gossypiella]|uniref:uncharacterized protein LOC126369100 n=1 Tax=Pectinophora gossypiella TaxID=13191 RepID=UPI00214E94D0|nr:uncharacterized protein LOC126369100 [Pectinophora gossypiella]